jgi:hypothetical protein
MARKQLNNANSKPAEPKIPARLDFPVWRKRFDQRLGAKEPSWRALQKWTKRIESFRWSTKKMYESNPLLARHFHPDGTDSRTEALQTLYRETLISEPSSARQKHVKFIRSALGELAAQAESFTKVLRSKDINIEADGGLFSVDLSPIAEVFERAACDSRYVLALLRQRYARDVNLVRQCVPLYIRLIDNVRATDPEAVGLLKIALLAHGYNEGHLKKHFAPRTSTLAKHAKELRDAFREELTDQLHRRGKYSRAVLQPVQMKVLPPAKH